MASEPIAPEASVRLRHYVMVRPTYFDVSYAINPWMDPTRPVDRALAMRQWEALVESLESLGHVVDGTSHIDCSVTDVLADGTRITIPYCKVDTSAQVYPCWQEIDASVCPSVCDPATHTLMRYGINIDRDGTQAPDGTKAEITCNTVAADPSACDG